jgi:hypothetical protein
MDLCVVQLDFYSAVNVRLAGEPECYSTSPGFTTGTGVASHAILRNTAAFGSGGTSDNGKRELVLIDNVVTRARRVTSQNSLGPGPSENQPLRMFAANDRASSVAWLSQSRISVSGTVASAVLAGSVEAEMIVATLLSCDRYSCQGCPAGRIMSLCYSAQQCTIEKCIGTPVNQRKPLCNVGATLQKTMEGLLGAMFGVWIVFTETYANILDLSFDTDEAKELRIESLDDAFFGEVSEKC